MSETLADKLLSYRRSKNMSQEDLAAFIGVRTVTVSRWERGKSMPVSRIIINKLIANNIIGGNQTWKTKSKTS